MGYKKYSPFLKSIKVLILVSFMYFTTRLDAVNLRIPVTSQEFDYHNLPVYCEPSTKHFKCKDENGTVYCLPDSHKCRIKCANDAELQCEHAATSCRTGQFRCSRDTVKPVCISEYSLCDGMSHCPNAEDEHASLCSSRSCGAGQFACRSPGHCLPQAKRCDGHYDCVRPGLEDKSDEEGCVQRRRTTGACGPEEFRCTDASKCVTDSYVCDGVSDCNDGSDELGCPLVCGHGELQCDNKCLPPAARCDGRVDCSSGEDEKSCTYKQCSFTSEFYCRGSGHCVPDIQVCDGHNDCGNGEDEVCPISHIRCSRHGSWTCKSGSHCVLRTSVCDGAAQCPDGSDELNCPTPAPPTPSACPAGRHLCNGTLGHCVSLSAACRGEESCPLPDSRLASACRQLLNSTSPCRDDNGGCEQACEAELVGDELRPRCGCRRGWRPDGDDPRRCVDEDECRQFGACSQLCRNTVGGYECSCRHGYSRHGNSCRAPGAAKILFSTKTGVEFVDTDTGRRTVVRAGLLVPKYVAYDAASRRVFFHSRDGGVGQVGIDGSGHRMLMRNAVLDAVAYDWARGLLFYTSPKRGDSLGHVGVLNVTTGARARLRTLDCPRGLAVHPEAGHLYVTLWCGARPGVYSMGLDGGQLQLVVEAGDGTPGHLALDLAAGQQRVYWVDSQRQAILSAKLNGSDARSHRRLASRPSPLSDLAVFEDRIYWNDFQQGAVYSVDKVNSSDVRRVAKADAVASVAVYHSLLQPASPVAACSCQHICVSPPAGAGQRAVCLCDDRYSRAPDGLCVNGTALAGAESLATADDDDEGDNSNSDSVDGDANAATASAPKASQQQQQPSVSSIAGVAIGAITGCLLVGVAVAVVCLRGQDKQSINFDAYPGQSSKHEAVMPKVNSRTPLTECEIDMDKF